MMACKGNRGTAPLIPNLGSRWRWVYNFTPRSLYLRERYPVLIEQGAGWAPEPVCTLRRHRKYFAPAGIRNLDCPVASMVTILPSQSRLPVQILERHIVETYHVHGYCEDRHVVVTKSCLTIGGRGVETRRNIRDIKILPGHRNIIVCYRTL